MDTVLNINENNTVDFDINGGIDNAVCIGNGYLEQMKDLARDIIGDNSNYVLGEYLQQKLIYKE